MPMSSTEFYKLVLALWGEDWRPRLIMLLAESGRPYTRQSLWNWRKGKSPVPEPVAILLRKQRPPQAAEEA